MPRRPGYADRVVPVRRVLVVTAESDGRFSTAALRRIVRELGTRPGVEVTTFLLRAGAGPFDDWGRVRVVDDLRTHPVSRALAFLGTRPSGWFKGRVLRRWLAEVDPDVVLLDDGLGERVVQPMSGVRPLVVVRPNVELPASAELESASLLEEADLVLCAAAKGIEAADSLESSHLVDAQNLAALAAIARAAARQRWSIPAHEPLIVGWGSDPWLDGTGLFIRTLWYLQHRHDLRAHGLWLGLTPNDDASAELQMEVERCELSERMHFQELVDDGARLAGDAVFLPHRADSQVDHVIDAVASGSTVVGFAPAILDDPSCLTVAPLDLDGAARALVAALREDSQRRWNRTMRLDVGRWVSTFIDAINQRVAQGG